MGLESKATVSKYTEPFEAYLKTMEIKLTTRVNAMCRPKAVLDDFCHEIHNFRHIFRYASDHVRWENLGGHESFLKQNPRVSREH